jgi:CheY-like chemotaxis protein
MASDILIVDDEADIRELVAGILQDEGHGTPAWPATATRRLPPRAHAANRCKLDQYFRPACDHPRNLKIVGSNPTLVYRIGFSR